MSIGEGASEMRLKDKVTIITGGASGLGEASARLFAANGAYVMVADIQDALGQQVCTEIGPRATYVHCDVTKESDVQTLVNLAVEQHGRLDVMFNNAGIGEAVDDLREVDMDMFDSVLSVNVRGVILGMKYAARAMVPAKSGCIINMASVVSMVAGGAPFSYIASKHAIIGLTRNAAVQLGQYGICVNSISPGAVVTPLFAKHARETVPGIDMDGITAIATGGATLRGYSLTPKDVANAAVFLASSDSKYISGHNLLVDGAYSVTDKSFEMMRMMGAGAGADS